MESKKVEQSKQVILKVMAREIIDSCGGPAIEAEVTTMAGTYRSSVSADVAAGQEAMCDRGSESTERRYRRTPSVQQAVRDVNTILGPGLVGKDIFDQAGLDALMRQVSSSYGKEHLSSCALLACSMAISRAAAGQAQLPLYCYLAQLAGSTEVVVPAPLFSVLSGGCNSCSTLPFREYLVVPTRVSTYDEAVRLGSEVYHELRKLLLEQYDADAVKVDLMGGFSPPFIDIEEPLQVLTCAVERAGHHGRCSFCVDCSASAMYDVNSGCYNLTFQTEEKTLVAAAELQEMYTRWAAEYPLMALEDPFGESDVASWTAMTSATGHSLQIVANELIGTDVERLQAAMVHGRCTTVTMKIHQVSTVSEMIEFFHRCKDVNCRVVISHENAETEDTFIVDLAVALGCGQIKCGAPSRERALKHNQLIRIHEELGSSAPYGIPGK